MGHLQSPSGTRVSVVVALPDPRARGTIAGQLRQLGHEVRTEPDPTGALLALADRPADAVVAPLDAPRFGGATLARLLRGRYGADAPLLVVVGVASADAEALRRAQASADACLLDPTPEQVCAELRALLERRAAGPPRTGPSLLLDLDLAPPCSFSDFDLEAVLGHGNHGVVYGGRRRADGAEVALKLLGRQVSEQRELLGRFLREVQTLAEVRSPHVVRVLGAGCARGRWFLAMERVRGRPASALAGKVDPRTALRIGRGVCAALLALDAHGLVHRDVKPANVVVDAAGRATLVDFGLAKRSDDRGHTSRNVMVGSPPYLAAETITSGVQDIGSDLYALGVTLWELLVGKRPFDARTPIELLELIAEGSPAPDARQFRRQVPASVAWLLGRLLEPDPARRLRDPREALTEITRVARLLGSEVDLPALV